MTLIKVRKKVQMWQESRRQMKDWEESQPFRVKVVTRPTTTKLDLVMAAVIVATWLPLALTQGLSGFGVGFLCGYIAISAWNHYRLTRQATQLGELVTRMERQLPGHHLDALEQITHGDPTIIGTLHSKPGSSGQWRSIAWFEADTTAFLEAPSDAPSDVN